ncbi:MAG: hypothetical protein JO030_05675 [Candidatus Eremiobacteraeota bacterium]|nr:hypothetical protein [Candidatus Eremiobacteraeota bacterium]
MTFFAVIYRPGSNWVQGRAFQEQDRIVAHRDFLREQFDHRRVLIAGPFLDDQGGIGIFECASSDELVELLQEDTTIAQNLLAYEAHPCALPFIR